MSRRAAGKASLVAAAVVLLTSCLPGGAAPAPRRGAGPTVRVFLGNAPRDWSPPRERATSVTFAGKRYRGTLRVVSIDGERKVINVVPLEEYLRGVVPIEIGPRNNNERAAVEAQAVAARTFTVTRMRAGRNAAYDLGATTSDQVYGGLAVERDESDAAIRSTAGLVLLVGDRVVDAPFHSSCGGETAAAEEVWRTTGASHLQRVSDRIPGENRYYCDIAPRFYWERTLTGDEVDATVARYLRTFVRVPNEGPGRVRGMHVDARTSSGRVRELEIRTASGVYAVRGNDARSVLRTNSGELLPSSYFSVTVDEGPNGTISRLLVRGNGYGHGVGMCQWGAIGRARAGQTSRTILRTYYPGTTVGPVPSGYLSN